MIVVLHDTCQAPSCAGSDRQVLSKTCDNSPDASQDSSAYWTVTIQATGRRLWCRLLSWIKQTDLTPMMLAQQPHLRDPVAVFTTSLLSNRAAAAA